MKTESWTATPEVEGDYWMHSKRGTQIVKLRVLRAYGNRLCVFIVGEGWCPVVEREDELWYGPLTPPPLPDEPLG